jgi:hypothetical protein
MRGIGILIVVVLFSLMLGACAAGPNPAVHIPASDGSVAGFWLGLWQGLISPITFVISLFTSQVSIYEAHNDGSWYNLGFVLGSGILFGGGVFQLLRLL